MEHEDTQAVQEVDATQETQEVAAQPDMERPDNSKEHNFRAIREAKEQAERERDEARQLARQLEQQYAQPAQQEPEDDYGIGEDDYVEGRHYRKIVSEVKNLRKEFKNIADQTTQSASEARLKAQYPDFDHVVSEKNINILKKKYPHLAQTLYQDPNLYSKGASAYTMIKELGITEHEQYEKDKQRAQANHEKPRPLSSISPQEGDSPMSNANAFAEGLTPELRAKLWKDTQEAMKNH